jgi:MFS family permease
VVIALAGVGTCFALNALSFAAMLTALARMDPAQLTASAPVRRAHGELRAALRHVHASPALWIPLAMMALVGTLSFNFQVLMPLLASETWHGTATTYALLTAAMAVGSVAGALASGARGRVSPKILVVAATGFGALELVAAAAPSLPLQVLALVPLGAMTVTFSAGVNSTMQLAVAPAMRGRVMALYSVVFLGSTPIGAPLVGWLAGVAGPRVGMALGACAALAAAALAAVAYARLGERRVATTVVAA